MKEIIDVPTIEELAEPLGRMGRASVKAELKRTGDALTPGEAPTMLAIGQYEGIGNSLLLVTATRLIAMNETGTFGKKLITRDVQFDRVTDVQVDQGVALGTLTLSTAGDRFEIKSILPAGAATTIANLIRQRMTSATAPVAASTARLSLEERLARARALLDSGAIEDAEYQSMRQRILSEA